MFKKVLYVSCFTLISMPAFADVTATSEQSLNFGTFAQVLSGATVSIDSSSGTATLVDGAIPPSSYNSYYNPTAARIKFESKDRTSFYVNSDGNATSETISFDAENGATNVPARGCSATISKITFSNNSLPSDSNSSVGIGATLTLSGFCVEGDYSGYIDINYTSGNGESASIPVKYSFSVQEPLKAEADSKGLNFGTWITPSDTAIIKRLPDNIENGMVVVSGTITQIGDNSYPAKVDLTGINGRSVSIGFEKSMTLYLENGGADDALSVSEFAVVSTNCSTTNAYSITLGNGDNANAHCTLYVGATLEVTGGAKPGVYRGQTQVTFIYND